MKHSQVMGGSTAGRVIACPRSLQLSRDLPPAPESEYAREGTLLHTLVEQLLLDDTPPPEEHAEVLTEALRQWDDFADEYQVAEYDTEQQVSFGNLIPGAFGTVDVIASSPTHNVIFDWKFGRGVAVSADSDQLRFYAVAASLTDGVRDLYDPHKPTLLAICQPRLEPEVLVHEVTPQELLRFAGLARNAVRLADSPEPAPIAAGKHCRWCPAKPTCPLKLEQARGPMPEDLPEALALALQMEDWARSVFASAEQLALQGENIPGWKLVAKRAMKKWCDEGVAIAALRKLRLPLKDLTEQKLKSPAAIEKLLSAKGKKMPDGLYQSKSSGLTLVPESDKRRAVPAVAAALKTMTEATAP